jgi:hypothetical protein
MFDGESPNIYFAEIMEFIEMKTEPFMGLFDKFGPENLWSTTYGELKLRHTVYQG